MRKDVDVDSVVSLYNFLSVLELHIGTPRMGYAVPADRASWIERRRLGAGWDASHLFHRIADEKRENQSIPCSHDCLPVLTQGYAI
jgi:hypothetical protein